jgi:flagellar biosynthesis/type III secretory pathway chaperone
MNTDNETHQIKTHLIKLLKEEARCARALSKSLEAERVALNSLDEKLITINSAQKQKLIESLQAASCSRVEFMEANKVSSHPAAVNGYVVSNSPDTDSELDILFIQLSEIAQQCFHENRLIGQLINRRTQFIAKTIASLSPTASMQSLTYGENGNNINSMEPVNSLFHLAKI